MSECKLESLTTTPILSCEICSLKQEQTVETETTMTKMRSLNEFCRDGSIKVHYSCSNHMVELFNQITKKENKSKLLRKKF